MAALAFVLAACAGGVTMPAKGVTDTKATVNGLIFNPADATVLYWFEYGETKSYGSETTHRSLQISDRDNHPVSEDLTGLSPGTTHHYRVCAKEPIKVCGADRKFTTTGGATELSITADPTLYPDFDPSIPDYVTRCAGGPVTMDVEAPPNTEVSIDGGQARDGSFGKDVPLTAGQSFELSTTTSGQTETYHVRCLPADFPEWTFERFAAPKQQFYVVAVGDYIFALDGNGVPVWWFDDSGGAPSDAKYLADGTFTWATNRATPNARYDIRGLDGSLVREMRTVGTMTDGHDIQLLDNGNYLLMSYKQRAGTVDLSQYPGGATNAEVVDAELQEINPSNPGTPVWTWNSKDHLSLDEIGHWWEDWVQNQKINGAHDIVHINSAEVTGGNSVVISMRHTDGVYKIDRATGDIVWKLGGTATPESLQVQDDPEGAHPLAGQHDARLRADGTLTVFDNGAFQSDAAPVHRAPRGVRYAIDENAGTATLIESVEDSDVTGALCCGSARRSDSGDWLIGWGGLFNPISEFTAAGVRTFKLDFPGTWSYRGHPVPFGELGRAALRNGMDAQHPR